MHMRGPVTTSCLGLMGWSPSTQRTSSKLERNLREETIGAKREAYRSSFGWVDCYPMADRRAFDLVEEEESIQVQVILIQERIHQPYLLRM